MRDETGKKLWSRLIIVICARWEAVIVKTNLTETFDVSRIPDCYYTVARCSLTSVMGPAYDQFHPRRWGKHSARR